MKLFFYCLTSVLTFQSYCSLALGQNLEHAKAGLSVSQMADNKYIGIAVIDDPNDPKDKRAFSVIGTLDQINEDLNVENINLMGDGANGLVECKSICGFWSIGIVAGNTAQISPVTFLRLGMESSYGLSAYDFAEVGLNVGLAVNAYSFNSASALAGGFTKLNLISHKHLKGFVAVRQFRQINSNNTYSSVRGYGIGFSNRSAHPYSNSPTAFDNVEIGVMRSQNPSPGQKPQFYFRLDIQKF